PIGLVRNDAIDLIDRESAAFERLLRRRAHRHDRVLERFPTVHPQIMKTGCDRVRARRDATPSTRQSEEMGLAAIRTHAGGEKSVAPRAVLKDDRTSAITKEDAGV